MGQSLAPMSSFLASLIPRGRWIAVALLAIGLSYLPILFAPQVQMLVLLPLVATTVGYMLSMRHQRTLIYGSLLLSLLALLISTFTWRSPSPIGRWELFGGLALSQVVIGFAQLHVLRSPWGHARAERRLKSRVLRQSQRLQAAQSSGKQTAMQYESDRRALLEHLPVHIVQKDCSGRFTFVTQSFCELVNQDFDYIIGRTDADLFPAEAAHKFMEDDQRVMAQGVVFDDVEQTELPDGTRSYMQVRKAPLRDVDGTLLGVQGIFWDVTEEHAGRQELKRIEALAHALIHAALDAVLIVDPDGLVLEANPASETILGYTQDQIAAHPHLGSIMQTRLEKTGQRATDPSQGGDSYQRKVPVATVLESATGKRIDARMRRSDGRWFDAEVSAHPLSIEGSEGWAMFVRDITRRKRSETELRSAKELAERANAAKSEFVANVSHELRTPLTGIIGLHELLQQSELDTQQQNYLQLAQVSTGNLLNLIDDLLDFSKIEAGRIEIEAEPFVLADCVEEAAVTIAARAQLRGLELVVDLDPQLPELVIGDSHRIKQVLLNLLGNAIKFTDKGTIRARASVQQTSPVQAAVGQKVIRFEVIDNGIGVPQEQREIIFDAFRQADSSTTRRYGGTGLGLTICRDLVNMMRGRIAVIDAEAEFGTEAEAEPASPNGSCFFFELPLTVAEPVAPGDPESPTRREQVVLIASPSPWRHVLQRQIEQLGFRITQLDLEQLAARKPAGLFAAGNSTIVIADYRELKALDFQNAPVVVRWILLTQLANAHPTSVPGCLKYADVKWLTRPVRRQELRQALETAPMTEVHNESPAASEIRPAQVLLVEDSPISQTVLRDMLHSIGHRVQLASNGMEAIQACREQLFDLVLMDIQMPEVDGLKATQMIRQQESGHRRQHILALTAHASAQDRVLCEAAGMDGFLVKPISLADLQLAISLAANPGKPRLEESPTPGPASNQSADNQTRKVLQTTSGSQKTDNQDSSKSHASPEQLTHLACQDALSDARDWNGLVALMHGNEPLLKDVLKLIVRELPKLAKNYSAALDQQDFKGAQRAVHTMKSNVRHLGLERIAQFAENLERMARDQDLPQLQLARENVSQVAAVVADWAAALANE